MDGYDLANEIYRNISLNKNHEISLNDAIRAISFWGLNEGASQTSRVGVVCYYARKKIKKALENALVWDDFALFNEMVKIIVEQESEVKDKVCTKAEKDVTEG